jgi:hypothetical protein
LASVRVVDRAGNQATVQPAVSLGRPVRFQVDGSVPAITRVTPNRSRFGLVAPFAQLRVEVDVSEDTRAAGGSLGVRLGAMPLTCTDHQPQSPHVTCTRALDGSEPQGRVVITAVAQDAAGNADTRSVAVELDFTPPRLVASAAAPPVAGLGVVVSYSLSVDEDLAAPPTLHLAGPGALLLSPVQGSRYAYTYTPQAGDVDGTYPVTVELVDTVGNTALGLSAAPVVVDVNPPVLLDVALGATRFSAHPGHNVVEVTFRGSEPLDVAGAGVRADLGVVTLACGPDDVTPGLHRCRATLDGTEVPGAQPLLLAV